MNTNQNGVESVGLLGVGLDVFQLINEVISRGLRIERNLALVFVFMHTHAVISVSVDLLVLLLRFVVTPESIRTETSAMD